MNKNLLLTIIFLSLISLSFASLISQISLNGPVSSKPLVYQNSLVVTMDNGKVGLFDQNSVKKWEVNLDSTPTSTIIFDNAIIVSTIKTNIYKIDSTGRVLWQIRLDSLENSTRLYGLGSNQRYIYATTDNGAYIIDKDGSVRSRIISYNATISSTPYVGDSFAIFTYDKDLVKVSEAGIVLWRAKLGGNGWRSGPVSDGSNVYIGALDSKVYSYSIQNGNKNWEYIASNWVSRSVAIADGDVYFGDNNGNIYSMDNTGSLIWQTHTNLGIRTAVEIGNMGGKNVIFLGSNDKNIYAIDRENGEVVWKGSVGANPSDVLYNQGSIIFGSEDGTLYKYSAERACAINEPHDGDIIGSKEIEVSGKDISQSGDQSVFVKINDEDWVQATTDGEDWNYTINPQAELTAGINTIECKIADSSGEESGSFTTVSINYDQTKPPSNLVVSTSADPIEGKNFTVYVNDGDDGSPVNRFTINVNGMQYNGSKSISLTLPAGSYQASVTKIGFETSHVTINVSSLGLSPVIIVIAVVAIGLIGWVLWNRVLKQRFAKK
ncbi:MAG: PQQ-binding-like beta-propeller repeat protein [Candidatus Bilamarchaeum sp.]